MRSDSASAAQAAMDRCDDRIRIAAARRLLARKSAAQSEIVLRGKAWTIGNLEISSLDRYFGQRYAIWLSYTVRKTVFKRRFAKQSVRHPPDDSLRLELGIALGFEDNKTSPEPQSSTQRVPMYCWRTRRRLRNRPPLFRGKPTEAAGPDSPLRASHSHSPCTLQSRVLPSEASSAHSI